MPIDTITGLPAFFARSTSRQIVSDATADPPGLSTRNTIAFTSSSAIAARNAPATVVAPIVWSPMSGSVLLSPRETPPTPYTSAIFEPPLSHAPPARSWYFAR